MLAFDMYGKKCMKLTLSSEEGNGGTLGTSTTGTTNTVDVVLRVVGVVIVENMCNVADIFKNSKVSKSVGEQCVAEDDPLSIA